MADSSSGAPAADGVRRTPLYDAHAELGARFVPFAGWDMPVRYGSILDEARAVRASVGLFDVSRMGRVEIDGSDAAGGDIKGASGSGERYSLDAGRAVWDGFADLPFGVFARGSGRTPPATLEKRRERETRMTARNPQSARRWSADCGRLSLLIPLSSLVRYGLMPVTPPSITNSVAVTKADSSDAR